MEPEIERAGRTDGMAGTGIQVTRRLDPASLIAAAIGGAGYWLLALLSLWLTNADATLAAVWLPNACAVAVLLRARLRNEVPFLIAIGVASIAGLMLSGTGSWLAVAFSVANLLGVAVIVWLTRRASGMRPNMTEIAHLAWFVWAGGLIGPIVSATLAAGAISLARGDIGETALNWFLAESMAMVLIVPAALLIVDALRERHRAPIEGFGERAILLAAGMLAVYFVFDQNHLHLLFLIPPITLLHAFRLGSVGTAVFVVLVAVMAAAMTRLGHGPMALMDEADPLRMHVIQAFIAANFLTGLPVAAVLAGRKRMMAEVEAGKQQLDLLAENITDAILRYDLNGVCTYASSSTQEVLGAQPSVFIGKRTSDRMHEDARERIMLAEARLLGGYSDKERFTYRRFLDAPDGSPVFIEAECAMARNPETGIKDGIVVCARDVTERVELELLLTRARRLAEDAARAKSEFLANMSHEIRTPMNGVLGFAEMMLESDLDEHQRRHARMIVESGRSMMLLLNDILDLSRIEAGEIAIDSGPVDLHSTILDCAALHRPTAEKKGLALNVELAAGPDPWVLTDGLRLRQILLNLIGNAVKFTQSGEVNVVGTFAQDEVIVEVVDTGIGISADRQETIFRPFTQGETSTARRFGGTGLGLSISRQLAGLLGGSIEVQSAPGEGSRFTLKLPARQVEPDKPPLPEPVIADELPPDQLRSSRILVAEDHDVNRMLVTEMLERCGQNVAVAHDGNEVIAMVIDSIMRAEPFDLVLMDIQMPGCDGYAATRVIRAEGIDRQTLPIIALTANAFPEDIAAARDAGMQAHLAKPVAFADLARALQRWLPTRIVDDESHGDAAHAAPEPVDQPSEVLDRWHMRQIEAVETVRGALERGELNADTLSGDGREALAQVAHKLAGTAAMFGETALGEQAASLERALRMELSHEVLEALALEIIAIADRTSGPAHSVNAAAR